MRSPAEAFRASTDIRSAVRAFGGSLVAFGRPALGQTVLDAARQLQGLARRATALVEPAADDVSIALPDLRRACPELAVNMYAGLFTLGSETISARGRSIFETASPSGEWLAELHGFTWLRHLACAQTALSQLNARALIADWIDLDHAGRIPPQAWRAVVVADRLRAFLTQSGWVLDGASPAFRAVFLTAITRHFRHLRQGRGRRKDGLAQIHIAATLLAATIAVPAFRRFQVAASRQLDLELKRQILADGGHISRNPADIIEVLADILPLRAAMSHAGTPTSAAMMNSIDRMLPMVRFFMLPSISQGKLPTQTSANLDIARFNGAAFIDADLLDAILAGDDTQGQAHGNASHSGYQRLEAAGTVIIMDCGTPPPAAFSAQAHAGTLSFECASHTNRFIVNCGSPSGDRQDWRNAARATAAHSTVVIGNRSSANVIHTGIIARLVGTTLVAGPSEVPVDRREHGGVTAVVASHDGYVARFGIIHERTLRLSATGDRIDGRDRLLPASDASGAEDYMVRFHIDPAIQVVALASGVIMLMARDGEAWEFHGADSLPHLEESVYLADPAGSLPTQQIVLSGTCAGLAEQRWTLVRTAAARV